MELREETLRDSRPTTPTGFRKSSEFSDGFDLNRSESRARSSRQVTSSHRRSSSFKQSQSVSGLSMSLELTRQTEGKFFALMDLVSSASREASSLKEIWSGLLQEREALTREREDLLETVTEVTESLDRKQAESHHHGHEHEQRKKQVEKLLLELSIAMSTISEHEKKHTSRDHEIGHARNELQTLRDSISRTSITHEKLKSDFEASELKIRVAEDERDHARKLADQYQGESRTLAREHTELKSKFSETSSRFETTRKEILSFADRLKTSESERDNYLIDKERLQELVRKAHLKSEETSLELRELTERHEHQGRDIKKSRETIRDLESDVERLSSIADHHRRELKTKTTLFDEVESLHTELSQKFEHLKREHGTVKDKLSTFELERIELHETIERIREESRLLSLEKNQLKDDMEGWRHRAGDRQRHISQLEETLRMTETSLGEVRSETQTLSDRLSIAERERTDARDKHGHHSGEIKHLKEKLVILQAELIAVIEHRDRAQEELHAHKQQYEEMTEEMTEYRDSSGGFELQIESLRTMLRESGEQRERAISARKAADSERDEYISRYEEKCREMERFEEDAYSQIVSRMRSEGGSRSVSSRVVTRHGTVNASGSAVHGGNINGEIHES